MKHIAVMVLTVLLCGIHTSCYALRCNCDDWIEKGGYCVDYIKERIPEFSIPYKDDMDALKTTDIDDVTEGDVAIFAIKNYWHVAYVEKVHRKSRGEAVAIDVREMNFGDQLSFSEFKAQWKSSSQQEWNRAFCCGITDNYDRVTWRKNIPLTTVTQVWSPDDVASEGIGRRRVSTIVDKARKVINGLVEYTQREL